MRWLFFIFFGFCSQVFADHEQKPAPGNQVYTQNSSLTVKNLNKAVEVLRDPTAMSGNFRQALRGLPDSSVDQKGSGEAKTAELGLPDIELVGKVFSENNPPSVVFKSNDKYYHFEEGDQISRVINHQVVTFHVKEISKHTVRVLVMPFNKSLIFN